MNFKIVRHEYENTGGGCMVSFDTIWLSDKEEIIFATTNDDGVCLYDTDPRWEGFEDRVPFMEAWLEAGIFDENEPYMDIISECLRLFICDDGPAELPYEWLTKDLQEKVDADYLAWCREKCYCIDTDGHTIMLKDEYKPPAPALSEQTYLNLVAASRCFRDSYSDLLALWNGAAAEILDKTEDAYPFLKSFGDLQVWQWVERIQEEAIKYRFGRLEPGKTGA